MLMTLAVLRCKAPTMIAFDDDGINSAWHVVCVRGVCCVLHVTLTLCRVCCTAAARLQRLLLNMNNRACKLCVRHCFLERVMFAIVQITHAAYRRFDGKSASGKCLDSARIDRRKLSTKCDILYSF